MAHHGRPLRRDRGRLHRPPHARRTASRGLYNHLAEAYAAPAAPDPAEVRDSKFAYGLDVVLDGLALRLPR